MQQAWLHGFGIVAGKVTGKKAGPTYISQGQSGRICRLGHPACCVLQTLGAFSRTVSTLTHSFDAFPQTSARNAKTLKTLKTEGREGFNAGLYGGAQ